MSKKRFWAIFVAACMALVLASCQSDINAEQSESALNTDSFIETLSIDNIVLDGVEFSLPCYFSELSNKFEENKHISFSDSNIVTIDDNGECYQSSVLFDDNEIGTILYGFETNEVFGIYINPYCGNYTSFSVDKIHLGETTDDYVFNEYGAPTHGGNNLYFYQFGKRKDITFVFDNSILQAIIINNVSDYDELFNK